MPNILLVDDKAPERALTETNCPLVSHYRGIVAAPLTAHEPAPPLRRAGVSLARTAQRPIDDVPAAQARRNAHLAMRR